jgi:hypothetical protein
LLFADFPLAGALRRLLGTTRSSSLADNSDEDFARDGPSKVGSMRLMFRFAMPSRCSVPYAGDELDSKCGDLRGR